MNLSTSDLIKVLFYRDGECNRVAEARLQGRLDVLEECDEEAHYGYGCIYCIRIKQIKEAIGE